MSEFRYAFRKLSSEPTITFGVMSCGNAEIVGPMNPKSVHYGILYGSDPDTKQTMLKHDFPLVHLDWNKYRSDLPPWDGVVEFVLADNHRGEVVEYTLPNVSVQSVATTGNLKTVTLSADGIWSGVDGTIIDRDEVAEEPSSQSFKVSGVLE